MERGFSSGSRSNNNYRLFMVFSSHSFFFFFIFSHSSHSLLPSHNNKNNNNKNNNNYERPRRNSLLNSFYCYIEIFICPRQEFFPSLSLTHSISLFVGFEREQFRMFLMDIWKFMYLFHIRCAQFCCFFFVRSHSLTLFYSLNEPFDITNSQKFIVSHKPNTANNNAQKT